MELFFLAMLVVLMAFALGSGYPVAFALPGSAILTIGAAAVVRLRVCRRFCRLLRARLAVAMAKCGGDQLPRHLLGG
jgi:TRAP-type mannitol/chloroaromatic compound transport system permease large subunit